ncbi:MAG: hypothetical protein ACRD3Q_12630 [Terriglobales bacterium]
MHVLSSLVGRASAFTAAAIAVAGIAAPTAALATERPNPNKPCTLVQTGDPKDPIIPICPIDEQGNPTAYYT